MPYRVLKYQATPNPNALKVVLDRPITDRPRSFRSRDDVNADPLAARFFAIDGVAGLFFSGDWLTVNKTPDSDWAPIKKAVEKELGAIDQ